MHFMRKKALGIVLALALMASAVPFSAFAQSAEQALPAADSAAVTADSANSQQSSSVAYVLSSDSSQVYYDTLTEAVENSAAGDSVFLLQDVELGADDPLILDKANVTLNLGNATLIVNSPIQITGSGVMIVAGTIYTSPNFGEKDVIQVSAPAADKEVWLDNLIINSVNGTSEYAVHAMPGSSVKMTYCVFACDNGAAVLTDCSKVVFSTKNTFNMDGMFFAGVHMTQTEFSPLTEVIFEGEIQFYTSDSETGNSLLRVDESINRAIGCNDVNFFLNGSAAELDTDSGKLTFMPVVPTPTMRPNTPSDVLPEPEEDTAPVATPTPAPTPVPTVRPAGTAVRPAATPAPVQAVNGEVVVSTEIGTVLTDNTATVVVSSTVLNDAISQAVENSAAADNAAPVVELALLDTQEAQSINVTLPSDSLALLAENENAKLTLTSNVAKITFDATALAAIADQADEEIVLVVSAAAAEELSEA